MPRYQAQNIKKLAAVGKRKSAQVAARMPAPVQRHPYMAAGGAMMVAGGVASGRRRSGLDKPQGRPTGIYNY